MSLNYKINPEHNYAIDDNNLNYMNGELSNFETNDENKHFQTISVNNNYLSPQSTKPINTENDLPHEDKQM